MLRVESLPVVDKYRQEKCNKKDQQNLNISAAEARGLKTLGTRVQEGGNVVLPTDKTGTFAVMSRENYMKAGLVHTQGDKEVGLETNKVEQREINQWPRGHVDQDVQGGEELGPH